MMNAIGKPYEDVLIVYLFKGINWGKLSGSTLRQCLNSKQMFTINETFYIFEL